MTPSKHQVQGGGGGQTPATLDPSAAGATPPPAQTGYGIPARRFITKAWASSRATPAIRIGNWAGLGIRPRETIRAVAQAGGWATRNTTIRQLESHSERAAAPTRDRSTPVAKAEGWPCRPKMYKHSNPIKAPIRCPHKVLRGDAGWAMGT